MIVDSSAVLAILLGEAEAPSVVATILAAGGAQLSAAGYVEIASVLDRRREPVASRRLDALLEELGIRIEPFDEHQARLARAGYTDFGRGSGHPARLNLGDAFSYGLASARGEPLLFIGNDFTHTDVEPALRLEPPPS